MDTVANILLALTAGERWAAARRMSPRSAPQQWLVLLGVAVLLVLLVLLIAISFRRRQQSRGEQARNFDAEALRRGLTSRERQILRAIAARGGLRSMPGIFHTADAFDRGAAQLFAEIAPTHTPQENAGLKVEVLRLREKLGFRETGRNQTARDRPSSRNIPVGKAIELIGGKEHAAVTIPAEVLSNTETEWIVALRTPVPSKAGDPWLVRYYAGMTAWEFRTSTVRCDGGRLALRHSDEIYPVERRRFSRVPVRAPALIAYLPLLQSEFVAAEMVSQGAEAQEAGGTRPAGGGGPVFVESTVTEFAGPGLRLETRLPVHVNDRVLVMVQLAQGSGSGRTVRRTLVAIGRVKHGLDMERRTAIPDAINRVWGEAPQREIGALAAQPLLIAVELIGLNGEEIDALVSLADEWSPRARGNNPSRVERPQEVPSYTTAAP